METLAYVHLAASSESSEDVELTLNSLGLRWFEQLNWKKLPSSAWIGLGVIAISFSILTYSTSNAIALQTGNQGLQVTSLQQKLTAAGYYNGPITGFYGSATQVAVRRFQEAQGLVVDGIAGPTTLSTLYGTASGSSNLPPGILLRRGSRGIAVTQLQNRLKTQGFYNGSLTGYYGRLTEAAVRDFQRSRGLSVNGLAGPTTLAALQGNPLGNSTTTILRRGSRGTAVSQLQNRLRVVGVYNGPVTGYYGELTEAAIRDFQRSRGLSVNGIADPMTLGALQGVSPLRNPTAIA